MGRVRAGRGRTPLAVGESRPGLAGHPAAVGQRVRLRRRWGRRRPARRPHRCGVGPERPDRGAGRAGRLLRRRRPAAGTGRAADRARLSAGACPGGPGLGPPAPHRSMSSVGATPDSTFAVTVVPAQRSSPRRVRWLSSKPAPPDTPGAECDRYLCRDRRARAARGRQPAALRARGQRRGRGAKPGGAAQLAAAGVAIRYAD
jgi:hypothetical protein